MSYSNYRNRELLVAIAKSYGKVVVDERGNEYFEELNLKSNNDRARKTESGQLSEGPS